MLWQVRRGLISGRAAHNAAPVIPLSFDLASGGHSNAETVALTTSNPNNVIVLDILTNGGPVVTNGITDTNGLTWNFRASAGASGTSVIERWWAVSPIAYNGTISALLTIPASFTTMNAYGITGARTASPFDAGSSVTGTTDPLLISTTALNTMIIGGFRMSATANPTEGSGFTKVSGSDFSLVEYKIVSSQQSNLPVSITTGSGGSNGGIADAIVQGP